MLYVRKTIVGPMAIGNDGENPSLTSTCRKTRRNGRFRKKEPPVVKEAPSGSSNSTWPEN